MQEAGAGKGGSREVVFDLDAAAFSSDEFRVYQFKVGRPRWAQAAAGR
jgi:hypothetical protein